MPLSTPFTSTLPQGRMAKRTYAPGFVGATGVTFRDAGSLAAVAGVAPAPAVSPRLVSGVSIGKDAPCDARAGTEAVTAGA